MHGSILARAEALSGATLEKADAASIRGHTGFSIGGVSPLGHLTPIETWFDPSLLAHPVIWAAAGTPNHVFAIRPAAAPDGAGRAPRGLCDRKSGAAVPRWDRR